MNPMGTSVAQPRPSAWGCFFRRLSGHFHLQDVPHHRLEPSSIKRLRLCPFFLLMAGLGHRMRQELNASFPARTSTLAPFRRQEGLPFIALVWMVALYPIGYHGGITHTIELPVAGDNHDLPLSTPDIGGAAPSNQPDVHVLRPVGFQLGLSAFTSPMTLVIQQEPPGGYTFPPMGTGICRASVCGRWGDHGER